MLTVAKKQGETAIVQQHCAPMGIVIAALLFLSLLAWPLATAGEHPVTEAARARYAWEHVLEDLKEQWGRLSAQLETVHGALLARAKDEDPRLAVRLSTEPPRPRPQGYGIIPAIREDKPATAVTLKQQTFSLKVLRDRLKRNLRDAATLAKRASANPVSALTPLVAEFERLRKRMRNLEKHLAYHARWQPAVVEYVRYFAERNRLVALMREMQAVRAAGPSARVAALRRTVRERVTKFSPTPGLAIETRGDGTRVLPVTVYTDIDDDDFLVVFREGVEAAFARPEAARARRFAVRLEFRRITPAELYPEGAPARGMAIDIENHLTRFPPGVLVLTTGAKRTHAWVGRNIILGPAPLTRRSLAHEFGHLLGFNDAYLRGYDGNPRDPFGVILVEWTGLIDNLMGNPGGGRVTEEMIGTLIEAYGKP